MTDDIRLCRTFQTAPAAVPGDDSAKYLRSGLAAEGFRTPDWLVPDLEDGTAPDMKVEGLENIVEQIPRHEFPGEIHPRVEWSDEEAGCRKRGREQVDRLVRDVGDGIDGVVVPKVGGLPDVKRAADAVAAVERDHDRPAGSIGLSVIVETARARSALREIAAFGTDSRLEALVFGPVDYTADLGGRDVGEGRPRWEGLLEVLSNEASAAGLLAVGGPFDDLFVERAGVRFYNADGYADQVEREARIGLDGSWSLHPKQTIQANRLHTPTPAELEGDVGRIERFTEAKREGTGAVTMDGRMVDKATVENFRNTVRTVRVIHDRRPDQTDELYDQALFERALAVDVT